MADKNEGTIPEGKGKDYPTLFDYEHDWVCYPEMPANSTSAKAPYVDYGTAKIDPERYTSKEEADLEWEHVWKKSWLLAGLAHDIPEIGDYFRYDVGKESFIIVRTGPGPKDIIAHYNVCPHRGNRIVTADFGSLTEHGCFQCDFHGWKFELDGQLKEIRDEVVFRKETVAHRPGLAGVRCDVWNSIVFINMDKDGEETLLESLDVVPEHCDVYPFEEYRVINDIAVTWDANWKVAVEAFIEFYHADDVHPQLLPFMETLTCQYDIYDRGVSRMILPMGYAPIGLEDRDTVSPELKMMLQFFGGDPARYEDLKAKDYKRAFVEVKRNWGKLHGYDFFEKLTDDQITDDWNYHLFPSVTLNIFSDSMLIQIFQPHATDPNKSTYRAISMCLPVPNTEFHVMDPGSFGPEAISPPGWDGAIRPEIKTPVELKDFGSVLMQDAMRVPNVQSGAHSDAFEGLLLAESEIRIRHYLDYIDQKIGRPSARIDSPSTEAAE